MSTSPPHDPGSPGSRPGGDGSEAEGERERLAEHEVLRLRAPNPGLLTLSGTNTWIVGQGPAWVLDPGPLLEQHLQSICAAIESRGGLGGVVLTHDHDDHSEAVGALLERYPAPLAAGRGEVDVTLAEGVRFGPFEALATPGHAADHFALLANGACFTGDAVLGEGSVFITPDPGAMSGYLSALARLRTREGLDVLCPGHGPPVWDPYAKLDDYVGHRLDREHRLIEALGDGSRTTAELLTAVWPEVPAFLHPAATATLAAHLDKLEEEQRLPAGVERPHYESRRW